MVVGATFGPGTLRYAEEVMVRDYGKVWYAW